jgi:RNA polymerase sigma factor for flagellar operon FliA
MSAKAAPARIKNTPKDYSRRDRAVCEHLPLVRAIAVRVHESLPVHIDLDDLVHAGIMGLMDAATKYNATKKVAFAAYAKHRIKGAILDSLRQLDWASRDLRRRHKQMDMVTRALSAELHRNPTEEEVANRMGVGLARWRQMLVELRSVGLISASSRRPENDDLPAPDFPARKDELPDHLCAQQELRGVLGSAMKTLPPRYQMVVDMYYAKDMTMREIGQSMGINESRVSQIHKAALERMNNVLSGLGVQSAAAFT